ncbi:MAG TPA: tetratricopeptide repeat protein [Thermoanaerobaculia bacterium]|nr:tetratricopeptide repeat protein [Thermoanaerobaculia bacterium]
MTDGAFPDRLAQLKARWEADPSSRVFLQLAEEYRHQGRMKEALAVLDRGLQEHPGYLSALVAKGRCHLELGEADASRLVLERVVKQDATQMVANKLLVRAYLETGDPGRARERLDLYSLLNDSDPEIGDLRRQIKLMDRPKEPVPEELPFDLGPAPLVSPPPAPAAASSMPDDIFDFGDVAGMGAAPRRVAPRPEAEDVFGLDEIAPPIPATAVSMAEPVAAEPMEEVLELEEVAEEVEEVDDDLFPGLTSRSTRQRYLRSLGSEGIFDVEPVPLAPSEIPIPAMSPGALGFVPPTAIPQEPPLPAKPDFAVMSFEAPLVSQPVEDASWLEEIPPVEVLPEAVAPVPEPPVFEPPVFEMEPPAAAVREPAAELWPEDDLTPLPELEEPEPWPVAEEPEPLSTSEPVVATATLGDIYLRQGHVDEAERIFREVLEREPDNGAARAGLGRIEEARPVAAEAPQPSQPGPLDAGRLLAGFRPGPAGSGTTARKIFLLNRYLDRIRGRRDVS